MGCFDFVYADNGTNIRRQRGYLYLTKEFATRTKFPNPLSFAYTNDYGEFTFRLGTHIFTLDVFAIYGCMAYLDMLNHHPENIQKLAKDNSERLNKYVFLYLNTLKNRDFTNENLDNLEEDIRLFGIDAFYQIYYKYNPGYIKGPEPGPITRTILVPKLGNQKEKHLRTQEFFKGNVPLLITRKKLPSTPDDDLQDIAANWGFCSIGDPKQGCGITCNYYCVYEKEEP